MLRKLVLALAVAGASAASAAPTTVLFVGNSYTFGRVDPVMSYNAANVHDLTYAMWLANPAGTNQFEPHPWGGVPGIFKQFTVQMGLDYDVSLSTRNAASLRGHFLNTNGNWDLRSNIAARTWDKVVLQEQSDEPLARRTNANGVALASNPEFFRFYADKIENFLHSTAASGDIRDRDAFPGATAAARQAACVAAGIAAGTCSNNRGSFSNPKANAGTEVYLYQTWARPNLVDGAYVTTTNPVTGAVTRSPNLSNGTFFSSLEDMTAELAASYLAAMNQADNDGSPGFAGIAPVGEAFLRAVQSGIATRDMWALDAATDGLIDLWFDDGTHASKYGSYLSALTLFGTLTGLNPYLLGANEIAARDLGISRSDAVALQRIAALQLGFQVVDEPPVWALFAVACAGAAGLRRRRLGRTAGGGNALGEVAAAS